jgi:pimeloyl-ACP methyl ester carboxylesterase
MRTARFRLAFAVALLLAAAVERSRGDPPAEAQTTSAPAAQPADIKQDFFASLKQGFEQDLNREVVRGHFDIGSPPHTQRYYCLVDPKTGNAEKNGVAGQPFVRADGMTGLKGGAVSPLSCADAEQKGFLLTSGYKVKGKSTAAAATAHAGSEAAPGSAATAGNAGAAIAGGGGGDSSGGTHRFYEVRGARLYTETFGHGPPILFLHGGMTFFDSSFAKQRDYFAARRTVIGIDQRGHGHSPDGPWTLSYQLMADDTAAIIGQMGLGPVEVVGQSDGGDIALLLARDHPELVRRVVVSGANLRSGVTPAEVQQRRGWSPEQLSAKLQQLSDSLPPDFRSDYGRVSPDGPDHWMTLLGKCYFMWIDAVVITPTDLKKIAAPVLVMAGDRDRTSLEETIEIYRDLPHGQLLIVPGSGHGTLQTRPDLVNPAILEFLDHADSGATAH